MTTATIHGYEVPKTYLCGCSIEKPCKAHESLEATRIRELEEIEISKLASHCDPLNSEGWTTVECHRCLNIEVLKGSQRELAEKLYSRMGWMIYRGSAMCFDCQNR